MITTIQKLEKLLGWLAPIQFLSIDAVNEAIGAIKQKDERIAELEAGQWVSVKDSEKPKLHERVFIYTTDYDGDFIGTVAHWNGDLGFLVRGGHEDKDVTHWKHIVPPTEQEQVL
jgi:hypothetical protein